MRGDDPIHERTVPRREVEVIGMLDSWYAGGGVRCHTNDQPALSR